MTLPSIEEQRAVLASASIRAPVTYRIIHVGTYVTGPTDVVARMVAALQSLGHDVVAVDPRAWPALGDSRMVNGLIPIEIDVSPLAGLIDRFRPHLMIWNAGGFHPSPTGADALRARGIPLLHVVLSDPDVQETTLAYLDRFDALATNALASVDVYRQAGARFVRHMPFAADRSFVLASVPPRPEWRAAVICVGNGRDDRQATMRRLYERFSTRAYGAKWEVPAEPVRGDDLVAALDAGKIHVNFPRTLAGFTNVKVGPFESIGRGGLLCTERFDEMARLFDYDSEIAGYTDADDLVRVIDGLLSDAGRLEQMRRAAFARLISEHLYEQRWSALFADLREANLLPSEPDQLDTDAPAALARALDETAGHARAPESERITAASREGRLPARAAIGLTKALNRLRGR